MHCLFCKCDSSDSRSIEHIIPESLGNTDYTLPQGFVCDKCNNYFARKVEKPFFDLQAIQSLRFQECIPNKAGKYQSLVGILDEGVPVKIRREQQGDEFITTILCDSEIFTRLKQSSTSHRLIFPAFVDESSFSSSLVVTRFLAKIALEALAQRLNSIDGLEYLVNHDGLDMLREHARIGNHTDWQCSIRRLYSIRDTFPAPDGENYQILNEYDFLLVNANDGKPNENGDIAVYSYFVIALFGLEFVISMAEPSIEGYHKWLETHNGVSPLYIDKRDASYAKI